MPALRQLIIVVYVTEETLFWLLLRVFAVRHKNNENVHNNLMGLAVGLIVFDVLLMQIDSDYFHLSSTEYKNNH